MCNTYRITAVLKVETDIITSISASDRTSVILVIVYVETFRTNVIGLIET